MRPVLTEDKIKTQNPISTYLFVLCAEILAAKIRSNKYIKGIKINNTEIKLSQYADDTSAYLDGSQTSLEETLNELDIFANISGLKTNFDKTQVVWIGSKKYSTHSIKTRWKLSWGTCQFKLLGITFDVDLTKIIGINYGIKIQTLKNSIKLWQRRALSPLGKITVIKSLLLQKITHLLIALPKPENTLLQEINTLFYDFLWKGRAKIKQSVVVKQYFEGGLKMVNLFAFEQALKITLIRRMLQDDSKWQLFIKKQDIYEHTIFLRLRLYKKIITNLKNEFWKDVLKALLKLQTVLEVDNGKGKADHIPIFYNKFLHIANEGFFYKSWFNNGVKYITDLIDSNGNFIKY